MLHMICNQQKNSNLDFQDQSEDETFFFSSLQRKTWAETSLPNPKLTRQNEINSFTEQNGSFVVHNSCNIPDRVKFSIDHSKYIIK